MTPIELLEHTHPCASVQAQYRCPYCRSEGLVTCGCVADIPQRADRFEFAPRQFPPSGLMGSK